MLTKTLQKPTPLPSEIARDRAQGARAQRFFFGEDVFVSYARRDSDYALALADELTKQELACFVDLWGTPPGVDLPAELIGWLQKSTMLVVIGTESAAASENVMKEVLEFKKTKRPIIPITFVEDKDFRRIRNNEIPEDLKGTLEGAAWYEEIAGIARTVESKTRLRPGLPNDTVEPSPQVVNRIVNAEGFLSRSKRLRKAFWTTALSLLALLVLAGILAIALIKRSNNAVRAAQSAEASAIGKTKLAEQRTKDAQKERAEAETETEKSKSDLVVKQGELRTAAAELIVANQKTQDEQAKAEKAGREAVKQGRIASSQELAARSASSLSTDPEASVLSARDAYNVWPTEQAGRALRHSLLQSHVRFVIRDQVLPTSGASFDSTGAHAVTVDDKTTTFKVWDMKTGKVLAEWPASNKANADGLEFSPDGNLIVIRGYDDKASAAYLWEWDSALSPDNPKALLTDVAHAAPVPAQCLQIGTCSTSFTTFSSDGKYVAAAGWRGVVWIWETSDGRRVGKVEVGEGPISEVKFRPNKDGHLATGDHQGQLLVADWKVPASSNSRWVLRPAGSGGSVSHIAFDSQGRFLAAALNRPGDMRSADVYETEVFNVFNVNDSFSMAVLKGHSATINEVSFSPNTYYLVSASVDGTARVYNFLKSSDRDSPVILRHGSEVTSAAFDPTSEYVLTAGKNDKPYLWKPNIARQSDIKNGPVEIPPFAALRGHTARTWARFSADGQYVLTNSVDGTARIWIANLEQGRTTLPEQDQWVQYAGFSPDGKHVVTASGRTQVRIWGVQGNRREAEVELRDEEIVDYQLAAFSPDGRLVIATGTRRQNEVNTQFLHVWEWTDKSHHSKPRKIEVPDIGLQSVAAVSHHPESPTFVVMASSENGTIQSDKDNLYAVRVWNLSDTNQSLHPAVLPHPKRVTAVALSYHPDSRYVATVSEDGVRVWDRTRADKPLRVLPVSSNLSFVTTVAFSPDGRYVAVGGDDYVAIWEGWKEDTETQPVTFRPSLGSSVGSLVVSVSFSPNSKLILTANKSGTLRLWEPRTGLELRIIGEYPGLASGASFSRDGRYIVAPYRKTARVYECAECGTDDTLLALVRHRTRRSERQIQLAPSERTRPTHKERPKRLGS
jgi:WD40 repeat protein